ncbi:hypothetical protein JTB14_032236 [Gonioctena quinquepunctata]|nr:hypothetical protein JTB14_032236 [Gonioctena quinquepunctata]
MVEQCEECGASSEMKCSACKMVSYCSKEHQKKNWKSHKILCRPFEICQESTIGKCLVATRDLKSGDVILSEMPVVHGPRPHMVEEGPVPCPGCCRLIIGENSPRCEGCDFPVCDPMCPGLKDMNKHGHECMFLGLRDVRAINGLHNFYRQDVLLTLRCLLLQNRHPKKYSQIMEMEPHLDNRGEGTAIYKDIEDRVVDYLHDNFFAPMKILEGKSGKQVLQDISKNTIHRICGLIDVNALEINQNAEVTALYPTAYLMEHSCLPNTTYNFDDDYKITIKAALPIRAGEHISTMYTHCLWEWSCDKCDVKLTNAEVNYLVNGIGEEVDNIQLSNPTVRELEALHNKMLTFLHPNHYHAYAVKHSLIQLYGYQQGYTPNQITDDCLLKKATMCRDILDINAKIDPGNARILLYTGVALHELFLANWLTIKRKWDLGIKTKVKSMLSLIQESHQCLIHAREVLKEEKNTPAGDKLINLVNTSYKEFSKFIERNKIELSPCVVKKNTRMPN